ncbi:hypothetical protein WJM97_08730 [Okeanomitos corallinicola TIOX110]|uniref:Uncharacterized protein n=1 Tax=Okeanomitos corallinicola TIOX110 TaxID=3133117 RepID=A0ABZ2UWQ5_9CYAN
MKLYISCYYSIECFRRNSERLWVLQSYTGESTSFHCHSIGFEGNVNHVYEDVGFDE